MKKIIVIFFITLAVLQISAQENVFSYMIAENIVTKSAENTKALDVNRVLLDQIISDNTNNLFFKIPLIDESFLDVNMSQFSVISPEHNLIIESANGKIAEDYTANFKSYYILHEGKSIGTFLYFDNSVVISYKYNNRQFELNKIDNEFLLFDINDCLVESTFSCKVEEKIEQINIEEDFSESSVMNPKCLELAIEIDQYTRNTFSSNVSTTNWAHAILAGVSQVYFSEVNLNISIGTTIIWETIDPYDSYVNDASNMLDALKNHWISNNSSISRDLVHLLTKRSNTGTGGIAYLDVLCNNSWGYGFSAGLNNTTNFNFPNPSYTWNLMVCTHEIGHNIGSNHTHWCGWPGGPIDNCTDVEGSCSNNPAAQVGTLMSYCHTTSSGSLIDFHPIIISNALTPGINGAGCLTSCAFYGCTDASAYNYDPSATIDDGSCCTVAGCTDPSASNYNSNACYDDGSCIFPVNGCIDPSATNYDSLANTDDGSCCYGNQLVITISTDNYPYETSWQLLNQNGTVVQSITAGDLTSANTTYTWSFCSTLSECYDFIISDVYGDGMCCSFGNGSYNVTYNGSLVASGGSYASSETTSSIGSCITSVVGCMNSNATNYDPLANTSIAFGGILDPNIGTGAYFNNVQHLIFDSYVPSKIVSAVVYASVVNNITFELRDNNSIVIDDTTINVVLGGQRLYFDFDVPVGNDYQLGIASVNSGLYRNNGGVSYPYDIGGLLNITASSAGAPGYYYFYYDIEVEAVCIASIIYGCTDPAANNYDVTATVDDGSCIVDVYGCTGPSYCNYNPLANVDDGSCGGWAGCMDPLYAEYNQFANCDDGSCLTIISSGVCSEDSPTGLFVDGIIHSRAVINWDNMNSATCVVDQYRIKYREVGTTPVTQKTMGAPVGSCTYGNQRTDKQLYNLTGATTYEYQMKAWYCGGGSSAWTVWNTFTTADDCPNVGNFTVYGASPTKATFDWNASNGSYEFVRIKMRVDSISNPMGSDWFQVGGFGVLYGTYTKNKNGLVAGESYRAQARTFCDPNGGAYFSLSWSPLVYWTQPTSVRLEGGSAITNLAIYPNPSRDVFNISFTSEEIQDLEVRVLNLIGEELINESLEKFVGEYTKAIDLANYTKGVYFLEITTNSGVVNKKLILQ